MIAACNGSVKQNGEEFTPELCDRMIAWLEFLVAAVDQEMHNKCGELCEYFDRAKVTLKDVDDRIAQHHQVMKDARQVPCIEHTAELATRMIDALTIVENVKKARDASDSICTSRLSPMYQYNMNIANTIVRYKSILESQAMQEIVRAKRTIACYEKNMDKFENNVRIIAEALQKFSSKYTCRATGYFSESDIAEFREISSGCENCDAFEQYMQRLNCDAFEQYMQCLNCCM